MVIAIDLDVAPILSVSYGQCERNLPPAEVVGLNTVLEQATLQGITVLGPTGDDGATDCDTFVTSATKGLAVDFPGSSPYVTGLGGTMFAADDPSNASAYWHTANATNGSSVIKHIPETVWNETPDDITGTPPTFGAGGGGASIYFSKPSWQTGPGVPDDGVRDVPDISLNAASNHDGYLVCILSSCTAGQFYNSAGGVVYGGTSAATPTFAGIMGLVEEGLSPGHLGHGRLGNINPNIYAMANADSSSFHDITYGDNKSPCSSGPDCPSGGGSIGFTAGIGYDQASGWGSIDAANFLAKWISVPPQTPAGTVISQTTVTATPNTVPAGTAISLAISVASGSPFTGIPTGTVRIQVDGTTVANSVPLTNGQVHYSLDTTGLTVQPHIVTVIYSGDPIFSGSQGTVNITITGAGTGGTIASRTNVTATPSTVVAGTAISLAITVAPGSTSTNMPTGSVQVEVDGATVGSSTALANGHASYRLNTSALTAGVHTVTVIYSGDTNFTGSQGNTTITITVPSTTSDFTITPSTASVSTIVGGKVPAIVFTLAPVNGFTGPITLSASDTSKDQLTPAFSVNPVVINSTNGATTTLTFTAFQSLTRVRGGSSPFQPASNGSAAGKMRWYAAGSGATLACMFLLVLPRRRRWGALLAVLLSIGAIGASGCGSGGTLPSDATYNVTITATAAGNLSHTAAVQVKFSIR
ncbi:MAG TPA: Ig-like domain repeat protein, partial [Edaphobacter sp.]|uniref:Ig-like domain repeat protein n=1 Tax=Edaphobacter sp. TaxID=1934404 RepID=UPI002B726EEE